MGQTSRGYPYPEPEHPNNVPADMQAMAEAINNDVDGLQAATGNIPVGGIILWSGSLASIPQGWALCNGSNGTPNLRDRFVVGAGLTYQVGETGGANNVTLTVAQMPSHGHSSGTLSGGSAGGHSHTAGSHSHSFSGSTGNDSHNHSISVSVGSNTHSHSFARRSSFPNRSPGSSANAIGDLETVSTNNATHTHSASGSAGNSSHNHSFSGSTGSASGTSGTVGGHSHSFTGSVASTGGGGSHENRPPYFALAYIMRVS